MTLLYVFLLVLGFPVLLWCAGTLAWGALGLVTMPWAILLLTLGLKPAERYADWYLKTWGTGD